MHLLLEFLPKLSCILIPDSFFSFLFGELLRFDIFDLIFCSLNILREDFKNKKKVWNLEIGNLLSSNLDWEWELGWGWVPPIPGVDSIISGATTT